MPLADAALPQDILLVPVFVKIPLSFCTGPIKIYLENTRWDNSSNITGRRQKVEGRSNPCLYKSQRLKGEDAIKSSRSKLLFLQLKTQHFYTGVTNSFVMKVWDVKDRIGIFLN
ncbi:hypothetical protein [Dissulfuribacter thermophilus]|uniref:hypothetical protein n=1 Tax=Dissulfuribacter thermophilus TaxID=1156395 RepID=UPI00082C0D29|nr:hypothetical protein [Dissulfuribacter thermophilus]